MSSETPLYRSPLYSRITDLDSAHVDDVKRLLHKRLGLPPPLQVPFDEGGGDTCPTRGREGVWLPHGEGVWLNVRFGSWQEAEGVDPADSHL